MKMEIKGANCLAKKQDFAVIFKHYFYSHSFSKMEKFFAVSDAVNALYCQLAWVKVIKTQWSSNGYQGPSKNISRCFRISRKHRPNIIIAC